MVQDNVWIDIDDKDGSDYHPSANDDVLMQDEEEDINSKVSVHSDVIHTQLPD